MKTGCHGNEVNVSECCFGIASLIIFLISRIFMAEVLFQVTLNCLAFHKDT